MTDTTTTGPSSRKRLSKNRTMAMEGRRQYSVVLLPAALVLILAGTTSAATDNNGLCLLCGDEGVSGLKRPDFNINSKGKKCVELALEMSMDYPENSNKCGLAIETYGEMCCGEEEPEPIEITPTPAPVYNGPMGDYPACPLCWDGTYPRNEAMVINMLYIGADSCRMYYHYGERGLIRTELCSTLQSFAYEPCGCGTDPPTPSGNGNGGSNGNGNGGGNGNGPQPTPAPTIIVDDSGGNQGGVLNDLMGWLGSVWGCLNKQGKAYDGRDIP